MPEEESLQTGRRILRPTVDVHLDFGQRHISSSALIDTGAPITLFPRAIGEALGIDFPGDGEPGDEYVTFLGHNWPCIVRPVELKLPPFQDLDWLADVRFVLEDELPFGILGYEGFLVRWAVSFNAYAGYTVVETNESFGSRLPVDPWEEFQKGFDGWDRPD